MSESNTKIGPKGKVQQSEPQAETIKPDEGVLAQASGTAVSTRRVIRNELILGKGVNNLPLQASYMDIAYAVSPWNDGTFSNGAFVLDKAVEIYKPAQPPLVCVLLSHTRYLAEWRNGADKTGMLNRYDTAKEAADAGETLPSNDRGGPMPTVGWAYDFYMLVRKPDGVESDKFSFKLGGHWYAYVKFGVTKGLGRDADTIIPRLCSWEAGVRDVSPKEGQCNRYFLDFGLTMTKKGAKTIPGLLLKYHSPGVNQPPEQVSPDLIRDTLSLLAMADEAPAAETDDCPL